MAAYNEDSVVYTMLDGVRAYLDDPAMDAKYNDAFLVKQVLGSATADVVSRLNNTNNGQIILKHPITLSPTVTRYPLPPNVGEIRKLVTVGQDGKPVWDARPRNLMHPQGEGWRVEGTPARLYLVVPTPTTTSTELELWYVPNGEPRILFGQATATATPMSSVVIATTSLGIVDRRLDAYSGSFFRWIPDRATGSQANEAMAEELIVGSTFATGVTTVELAQPLVHSTTAALVRDFEVVPMTTVAFKDAVVLSAALKVATMMKASNSHRESLRIQYLSSIKTASDNLTFIQTRTGDGWRKDTVDNQGGESIWRTVGFASANSIS